ncbi:hypothetical protein LUZ60_009676 [Juncus effusus]|nr:hypothetical protein LUZ60_009676 [Juncus effusus]
MQRKMKIRFLQFLPLLFLLPFSFSRLIEESRVEEAGSDVLSRSVRFNPSKSEQISSHPRVFSYEGFLSDDECEHLISLAGRVKNNSTRTDTQNSTATGTTIFLLNPGQDETISRIEERISLWTLLPKDYGSGIQINHYKANESNYKKYKPKSGNIFATILISLSNVTNGGEIIFPKSSNPNSKCGSSDFALKPKKGTAIILFNLNLDSTEDKTSLHLECPVLQGAKWSAVKYIHIKPLTVDFDQEKGLTVDFGQEKELTVDFDRAEECVDMDDNCVSWAKNGECERNPVFMLGSPDYYGTCRKSCNAC